MVLTDEEVRRRDGMPVVPQLTDNRGSTDGGTPKRERRHPPQRRLVSGQGDVVELEEVVAGCLDALWSGGVKLRLQRRLRHVRSMVMVPRASVAQRREQYFFVGVAGPETERLEALRAHPVDPRPPRRH